MLRGLEGWGERSNGADNAIDKAKTPVWHELMRRWPHAQLNASEHYVGLPDGQRGNSEVGHTNIGAGRVVIQDLPRIDKALAEGKVADLPALQEFIGKLKKSGGTAHVMGLISPGGVHSHQHQIAALAGIVADAGVPVAVHAFLDGRDTPPQSAIGYLRQFQQDIARHGDIRIVTVSGRYYAMDRDKRWDRVAKAYQALTATIGEIVAEAGMKQLRIAETEKYAHVTFFFNGGRETVFPGEERILVPSPKVATYDQQPEMSAPEVTDKVVEAIRSGHFDVVVLNYANTDMVGHTGKLDAAIKAVESVDACLGRLSEAVEQAGGTLVITADHGNAEMMRDPKTGEPHTAHTLNPVPFITVNPPGAVAKVANGRLADVAPTLLDLLGLPKPAAMTGHSLIVSDQNRRAAE